MTTYIIIAAKNGQIELNCIFTKLLIYIFINNDNVKDDGSIDHKFQRLIFKRVIFSYEKW